MNLCHAGCYDPYSIIRADANILSIYQPMYTIKTKQQQQQQQQCTETVKCNNKKSSQASFSEL